MRLVKRGLLAVLALLALVVGGGLLYASSRPLKRDPPSLQVDRSPERVKRGEYLSRNVMLCTRCHSELDRGRWSMPPKPGTEGAGACMPHGACYPNIGSHPVHGLGSWTDGEILRAIREGVNREGRALWTLMPYQAYRELSDEDAEAVVAYLRTLPAFTQEARWPRIPFPFERFLAFVPRPLEGAVAGPPPQDSVARGRYLVRIASCGACHSPQAPESDFDFREHPLAGRELSGGVLMQNGKQRSTNLTPHPSGLGERTREAFIAMFKAYATPEAQALRVPEDRNTEMPWLLYAGMTEEDLGAIYDYLRTLPPTPTTLAPPDAEG